MINDTHILDAYHVMRTQIHLDYILKAFARGRSMSSATSGSCENYHGGGETYAAAMVNFH
jgi:hypothetical protein